MPWLISYQSCHAMRHEPGVSLNAPVDQIEVVREHPAEWFASKAADLRALEEMPYNPRLGPQTAYVIVRIYSAIEVPAESAAALYEWQKGL